MEQFLASKQVTIRPEFELATSDMLIQFAVRNLGIASVVRNFAEEHLAEGDLFELRFLEEIPARTFCIVANERIPLSAAAATLMNVLVQGKMCIRDRVTGASCKACRRRSSDPCRRSN